jgi:hypothetical protein
MYVGSYSYLTNRPSYLYARHMVMHHNFVPFPAEDSSIKTLVNRAEVASQQSLNYKTVIMGGNTIIQTRLQHTPE